MTNIVIIGAGKRGSAILEHLSGNGNVVIKGIVDRDADAPGIARARQLNIPTGSAIGDFISGRTDLIINSTGSMEVDESLRRLAGPDTEIIGSLSSMLIASLSDEADRFRQRVRFQTSILEQIRNAVIVAGMDGEVFYMNPYAEKLYQYESGEALGRQIFSVILKEDRKTDSGKLLEATLFEGYWEGEISARKKDGTNFPAYLTNSVMRDSSGSPAGIISVSSDISELKKTEADLKAQLNVRRALEEAVLPGIVVYDAGGRHIYVNRGFSKIVGWSEEELIGMRPPFPYWPEEAVEHNMAAFTALLDGRAGAGMIELSYCRRSGERFYALILTAPFYDEFGRLKGWASSVSDVTEYKLKEEQLSNSREQLRSLSNHLEAVREAEKADLAHRLHDEIGQPLAALKLELVSLARKLENGHRTMLERTDVMRGIIDKGIQAVKGICFELRPWILDDMGIAEAVRWQTAEFEKRTAIKCELFIDPQEIELSRDLSTAVFRIYQELLRNIERHARATKVSVSLVRKGNGIIFEVKDNGAGIPDERIYDSGSFGIIGIREKVLIWGGDFAIRGEDKIGTTVRISIPLRV